MRISDVIEKGAKYSLDLSTHEIMRKLFEHAGNHADAHNLQLAFNTLPLKVRTATIKDFFEEQRK